MRIENRSQIGGILCAGGALAAMAIALLLGTLAIAGEKVDKKQVIQITAQYLAAPILGEPRKTPNLKMQIDILEAIVAMVSENPLVTGLLTYTGQLNVDSEGNGVGGGTGLLTVIDGDTQAPTGGLWRTKWEFKGNMNGPYTVKVIGHGIAGEVEGMQFSAVATWVEPGLEHYEGQLLNPKAPK
jgi:hypothetical protein